MRLTTLKRPSLSSKADGASVALLANEANGECK
jgi:hypothetical protein